MDVVKRMSRDLVLVNRKGLNETGKVMSHDFHRVNQSTHRWHKERHTNYTLCGQSHSQLPVNQSTHRCTKNATLTTLGVASHIASCP